MIVLEDLTLQVGREVALSSANVVLPSDRRVALLGPSDNDKAILIKTLAGVTLPTSGRVVRYATVSFPVGQLPGFNRELSVRVNVAHVARLYGASVRETLQLVEKAFGRSASLDRSYADWPREMRKPLSQITALAIPFNTYLFMDQRDFPTAKRRTAPRERGFNLTYERLVQSRMATSGMIIPTNDLTFAKEHCEVGAYLDAGRLELLNSIEDVEASPLVRGRRRQQAAKVGRLERR